jgi:hypothetical protein
MDPWVLPGPYRSQQRGTVRWVLELADDQHVDRVR